MPASTTTNIEDEHDVQSESEVPQLTGPAQLSGRLCSWKLDDCDDEFGKVVCHLDWKGGPTCNKQKSADSLEGDYLLDFSMEMLQKANFADVSDTRILSSEYEIFSQDKILPKSLPCPTDPLADMIINSRLTPSPSTSDFSLSGSSSAYLTSSGSDSELGAFETVSPRVGNGVMDTPLIQPLDASEARMLTIMLGDPATDEFSMTVDRSVEEGSLSVNKTDPAKTNRESNFSRDQRLCRKSNSCGSAVESRRHKHLARENRREFAKRQRAKARARAKARTRAKAMANNAADSFVVSDPSKVFKPNIQEEKSSQNQKNEVEIKGSQDEKSIPTKNCGNLPRLEARKASQYYRDKAKTEFNDMVKENRELLKKNVLLRKQLREAAKKACIHNESELSLPPAPKHTDVTSKQARKPSIPYKEGETRRERNRRAAKRSRENAKRRFAIIEAENAALNADNHALATRLQRFGFTAKFSKRTRDDSSSDHRDVIAARANKKRRVAGPKSSSFVGDTGAFSLLLICGALSLMMCYDEIDSPCTSTKLSGSQALNTQRMSMSIGRGMQNLAISGDTKAIAGLICIASSFAWVLYFLGKRIMAKDSCSNADTAGFQFRNDWNNDILKLPSLIRLVSK